MVSRPHVFRLHTAMGQKQTVFMMSDSNGMLKYRLQRQMHRNTKMWKCASLLAQRHAADLCDVLDAFEVPQQYIESGNRKDLSQGKRKRRQREVTDFP